MKLALRLARRGLGRTSPNPMVGAVIVKNGRIIGQGYHRYFGGDHAEIDAMKRATEPVAGSDMYVTLEPCCHHGKKTPPCADALIEARIGRVIIASLDPNPQVSGKGVAKLNRHGIKTEVGLLAEQSQELNRPHFKLMSTGLPFITLKYAQTLDGRIAAASGDARWISSEEFRRLAHQLRASHDAIIVGVGTVITDDPELTVRLVRGRNPLRIVLDSNLSIPLDSRVVTDLKTARTLVATTSKAGPERTCRLNDAGVEVLVCPANEAGEVDIKELLAILGKRGISSGLIEGGSRIITDCLHRRLMDRIIIGIAPKMMGKGIDAVGDLGISAVGRALKLSVRKLSRAGEDLVIEAEIKDA